MKKAFFIIPLLVLIGTTGSALAANSPHFKVSIVTQACYIDAVNNGFQDLIIITPDDCDKLLTPTQQPTSNSEPEVTTIFPTQPPEQRPTQQTIFPINRPQLATFAPGHPWLIEWKDAGGILNIVSISVIGVLGIRVIALSVLKLLRRF